VATLRPEAARALVLINCAAGMNSKAIDDDIRLKCENTLATS